MGYDAQGKYIVQGSSPFPGNRRKPARRCDQGTGKVGLDDQDLDCRNFLPNCCARTSRLRNVTRWSSCVALKQSIATKDGSRSEDLRHRPLRRRRAAQVRRFEQVGCANTLRRAAAELDLLNRAATHTFLDLEKPDFIFMAAARGGGIHANNSLRANFIHENLMVEANLIHGVWQAGVQRLCFLGSSCIYPRDCSQPISEDYLLTGPLESTNEPHVIAKIAGIKLCESYNRQYGTQYFSAMPTKLYGPNDSYDLANGHVLPALIRKAHEAKQRGDRELVVWGSGKPRRELLHLDDLEDVTIRELAETVMSVVGFNGRIAFDASKPDGTPRKQLDVSRLRDIGWQARIPLRDGIALAFRDFLARDGD